MDFIRRKQFPVPHAFHENKVSRESPRKLGIRLLRVFEMLQIRLVDVAPLAAEVLPLAFPEDKARGDLRRHVKHEIQIRFGNAEHEILQLVRPLVERLAAPRVPDLRPLMGEVRTHVAIGHHYFALTERTADLFRSVKPVKRVKKRSAVRSHILRGPVAAVQILADKIRGMFPVLRKVERSHPKTACPQPTDEPLELHGLAAAVSAFKDDEQTASLCH